MISDHFGRNGKITAQTDHPPISYPDIGYFLYVVLNAAPIRVSIQYPDTGYPNVSEAKSNMSPQDIVVLLKIIASANEEWLQISMAKELGLAQSEMSRSIARSKYAGLLNNQGRKVRRLALMDFIKYGLPYAFPQRPGSIVRGVPTSHSASPLKEQIQSDENFVWPYAKGKVKGQAVTPLYRSVPKAVQNDPVLHELLALVDAIRLGNSREKNIAIKELKHRILDS